MTEKTDLLPRYKGTYVSLFENFDNFNFKKGLQ